jgi:hypothetical protein
MDDCNEQELQSAETWEEQGETRPPVKSPRAIVSVAFGRDDFERVAEYARRHGLKTSEFIRQAALTQIDAEHRRANVVAVSGNVRTNHPPASAPNAKIDVRMPQPRVRPTG